MKIFIFLILLGTLLSCSKEPDYRDKYVGMYRTELLYLHREKNIIQKDTGFISIEKDNDKDSGLIFYFGDKMRFEKPPVGTYFNDFYMNTKYIRENIESAGILKLKINSIGGLYSNSYNNETERENSEFYIYSNLQLCLAFNFSLYIGKSDYLSVRFNGMKL